MNIGVIHTSFEVSGGAEITTVYLLEALMETDNFITLYTVNPPQMQEVKNFRIHKIPFRSFPLFWKYQRIKEEQQLFHDSNLEDVLFVGSGGLTLHASKTRKVMIYCNSTFEGEYRFAYNKISGIRSAYHKIIQKKIKKSFEVMQDPKVKMIANSKYTSETILRLFQKNSIVIYPPVDITKYLKWSNHPKENKVITISRYSPEKNLEFAVRIVKDLDIQYKIIGTAKLKSQLELYEKLNKTNSKNVELLCNTSRDEINMSISSAKVYFHPSKETFGISVVESIAAGCVPIVPNNSAHNETVPFEDLRYEPDDPKDAREHLVKAIKGDFDEYIPKLQQHVKIFDSPNFKKKIIEQIKM
ncbi:MAG: glycosyltransferase family 4 protein [Nitrosotalea sp.]